MRGDNRDKSGINGDFLCNKGRYAFDFANYAERITQPLVRQADGKLKPVTWEEALTLRRQEARRAARHPRRQSHRRHRRQSPHQRRGLPAAEVRALGARHQQHRPPPHGGLRHLRPGALARATGRTASLRDTLTAKAVLLVGGDPTNQAPPPPGTCAPPSASMARSSTSPTLPRSSCAARPRPSSRSPSLATARSRYLAGDDSAASSAASTTLSPLPRRVKPRRTCSSSSAPSFAARTSKRLIDFGLTLPGAKFALLGDYANSRGAADMGLLPDMLPGYVRSSARPTAFAEYPHSHATRPRSARRCSTPPPPAISPRSTSWRESRRALHRRPRRAQGHLRHRAGHVPHRDRCARRRRPSRRQPVREVRLRHQHLRRPAAVQQSRRSRRRPHRLRDDRPPRRQDGRRRQDARPLRHGGVRADMGQTRGAQSGEADRHAVWLTANNLEPRLSPFDPMAILDEIQRLVPGYTLSRLQLLSGNDQHLDARACQRWSRSADHTAAIWSCPPATRSSPPARSAATPPALIERPATSRTASPTPNPTSTAAD